jgi:retron-type reverse transcriptase
MPNCVHGFVPNRNIVTNARKHTEKNWVLNFDLAHFFDSITYSDISNLFLNPPFRCGEKVAKILSLLTVTRIGLPQGAPTSPVLSNLIAMELDRKLMALTKSRGITYTRYADDITFSSDSVFDDDLVEHEKDNPKTHKIGPLLEEIIHQCGFKIHPEKTRLQSKNQAQTVTGLRVNEKVNVNRKFIREVRAMIYKLGKHGLDSYAPHQLIHAKKQTYHTDDLDINQITSMHILNRRILT